MKIVKTVIDFLQLILTGKGRIADEAVEQNIVDYSGQGRDEFGK